MTSQAGEQRPGGGPKGDGRALPSPIAGPTDDGMLVVDMYGVILEANTNAAVLLGRYPLEGTEFGLPLVSRDERAELDVTDPVTGEQRIIEIHAAASSWHGRPAVTVLLSDATHRIQEHRSLIERAEHLTLATAGANDGLWDWDVDQGVLQTSPRWQEIVGVDLRSGASTIEQWLDRVHVDDVPALSADLDRLVSGQLPQLHREHRLTRGRTGVVWVLARGSATMGDRGRAVRVAGSLTDISAQKAVELRLEHDALHDSLTGLPNRMLLADRIEHRIAALRRDPKVPFAVMFVDLDGFKAVNDTFGHAAGDQFLIAVADRIVGCLRPSDTLARVGGDEFAVLLASADEHTAERVATRLLWSLGDPVPLADRRVQPSASVGVAVAAALPLTPAEVMRRADVAMYHAKHSSGPRSPAGRHTVFNEDMRTAELSRVRLQGDVEAGVVAGEFQLHLQPVVDLRTGRARAWEGLLRWDRPGQGVVTADEVLPALHGSPLLDHLSWISLERAAGIAAQWAAEGYTDARVLVNTSRSQLANGGFTDRLVATAHRAGAPPSMLGVEVPHDAARIRAELVVPQLSQMRAAGMTVVLDDIGRGPAPLSLLTAGRADLIKLDRALVAAAPQDRDAGDTLKGVVGYARAVGIEVVAEGVETPEQLEVVRDAGCECAQGFLLLPPVPAAEATVRMGGRFLPG